MKQEEYISKCPALLKGYRYLLPHSSTHGIEMFIKNDLKNLETKGNLNRFMLALLKYIGRKHPEAGRPYPVLTFLNNEINTYGLEIVTEETQEQGTVFILKIKRKEINNEQLSIFEPTKEQLEQLKDIPFY